MFNGMSLLKVTELASEELETFNDGRGVLSAHCMVGVVLDTACGISAGIQKELDQIETDIRDLGVTTSPDEPKGVQS